MSGAERKYRERRASVLALVRFASGHQGRPVRTLDIKTILHMGDALLGKIAKDLIESGLVCVKPDPVKRLDVGRAQWFALPPKDQGTA